MATIKSIEAKLQERAPFFSVQRFKSGFSIAIENQPFLLTECQKYLGAKLVDLSDDDIDRAISEAIPTAKLVKRYENHISSLKTKALADIDNAYTHQKWDDVGDLAYSLTGFEDQLKILETASKYATNK